MLLEMKFGEGTMARNGSDRKGKYEVKSMNAQPQIHHRKTRNCKNGYHPL